MKNVVFPNFDFDFWLKNFVFLLEKITLNATDFERRLQYMDENDECNLIEKKEYFYAQIHNEEETETWDYARQYIDYMILFNIFIKKLYIQKSITLNQTVQDMLVLRATYKTDDFNETIQPKHIGENVAFVLKTLNIPFNDD